MSEFNNINLQDVPDDGKGNDFYTNFRTKLNEVEQFPTVYTFKFIIEASEEKINQVKEIFKDTSAKFSEKESSKGKYKSLTVEVYVQSADQIIDFYKQVSTIESVIML